MSSRREVLTALVRDRDLFGLGSDAEVVATDQVHGHLLAPIILLATRDDVLAKVLPPDGSAHPEVLYKEHGVDPTLVPESKVQLLAKYRVAFAALQVAWFEITNYDQPPCLDDERMRELIDFTRTLAPKAP